MSVPIFTSEEQAQGFNVSKIHACSWNLSPTRDLALPERAHSIRRQLKASWFPGHLHLSVHLINRANVHIFSFQIPLLGIAHQRLSSTGSQWLKCEGTCGGIRFNTLSKQGHPEQVAQDHVQMLKISNRRDSKI